MARIKIKDLPKDAKISKAEMRRVTGGAAYIKFDGIEGEAQDKYHKGWSDIMAFQSTFKF